MKKRSKTNLRLLGVLILAFSFLLTACGGANNATDEVTKVELDEPIKVLALKGPTAMGMAEMMKNAESEDAPLPMDFQLEAAPEQAVAALLKGEADIAAIPANLAAVLYQKTEGNIEVLNINTLGVLYIVEQGDSIQSIEDLKGKTLYASGKGATPEYCLNYLLDANGMSPEDVNIQWKKEHTEALSALSEDPNGIALLPEPFVTVAKSKMPELRSALNLTEEWDAVQAELKDEPDSALIMGVTVARKDFIDNNPDAIKAFLALYQESVDFVNEKPQEAAQYIDEFGIVKADIAEKAIPNCHIVCITGDEMKEKLSGYFTVLMNEDPKSIGGEEPADEFYWIAS